LTAPPEGRENVIGTIEGNGSSMHISAFIPHIAGKELQPLSPHHCHP